MGCVPLPLRRGPDPFVTQLFQLFYDRRFQAGSKVDQR